jgi:hypothetical protein
MTRRSPWLVLRVGVGLVGLCLPGSFACSRSPSEPVATTSTGSSPGATSPPSAGASVDTPPTRPTPSVTPRADLPLLWNDPPHFVRAPPKSPARVAQYAVPRAGPDPEDAECVVMTFGPRQGGSVEDNVKRWMDQFNPALPTPRRMTADINGMHVTFVEVAGTFAGNMMPNGPNNFAVPTKKPGWRLIGAIVEAPSGLWFFKMTGPDLTVRSGAREFEDMVRSTRPR